MAEGVSPNPWYAGQHVLRSGIEFLRNHREVVFTMPTPKPVEEPRCSVSIDFVKREATIDGVTYRYDDTFPQCPQNCAFCYALGLECKVEEKRHDKVQSGH